MVVGTICELLGKYLGISGSASMEHLPRNVDTLARIQQQHPPTATVLFITRTYLLYDPTIHIDRCLQATVFGAEVRALSDRQGNMTFPAGSSSSANG